MSTNLFEELSVRLALLEARQEIQEVVGRLCRAQDRHDIDAMEACYHPDGYDDHLLFKGSPREFAEWLVESLSARFEETLHFVGPSVVEVDGDIAQVNTECMAHHLSSAGESLGVEPGGPMLRADYVMSLRYLDRFERRNGRWLIAHRRCVWDWAYYSEFEGSIKGWSDTPEIVWSRKDKSDPAYEPVPPAPSETAAVRVI
jgi:hypothetical protein